MMIRVQLLFSSVLHFFCNDFAKSFFLGRIVAGPSSSPSVPAEKLSAEYDYGIHTLLEFQWNHSFG